MMGGALVESVADIPQVAVAFVLFGVVLFINVVGVGVYGLVESWVTVALAVIFAPLGLFRVFHAGELSWYNPQATIFLLCPPAAGAPCSGRLVLPFVLARRTGAGRVV